MEVFENTFKMVKMMLKNQKNPTIETIRNKVDMVLQMLTSDGEVVDFSKEELVRRIEAQTNVWSRTGTELKDKNILPWLADKKSSIPWDFWGRYENYLEEEKGLPTDTIIRLGELTDSVLDKLQDPKMDGQWDRRGMVVGHVQSGKTSNYTGLICKAVDSGYKLIIVLAGLHDSLRSQTQLRLDEGFLGYDTQRSRAYKQDNPRMGAANHQLDNKNLIVHSLTDSTDKGDFKKSQVGGTRLGGDPVLLVVKKHKSILINLLKWALSDSGELDLSTGKKVVRNIPLLVIDDEADNASVNTKQIPRDENGNILTEEDPSAINAQIRNILNSFDKSAYVGYTATPFANIFIAHDEVSDKYGEDLFPRSFIINLPAPSNYVGPAQVFGLEENLDIGINSRDPLPIVHSVSDYEPYIPTGHKKTHIPHDLPPSLKKAIKVFILSSASRIARGQTAVHNSMLIHVTRFTDVQKEVSVFVKKELKSILKRLEHGEGNSSTRLIDDLKDIWETEFVHVTKDIMARIDDPEIKATEWSEVESALFEAAVKIKVLEINGKAKDVLNYFDHKNGLSVIAIGGDKLSRGLTLEGLTVSYYLRASKMYDTLMQMGRWFGYRPGYLDLCRLYTSEELIEWYQHITVANEELRNEFDYMSLSGLTPMDYGLKVQTHPDGLIITGVNKLRNGTKMQVSYAGTLAETVVFEKNEQIIAHNFDTTKAFICALGRASDKRRKGNFIWEAVNGAEIATFLAGMTVHQNSRKANVQKLAEYIEKQLDQDQLTEWTVALISSKTGKEFDFNDQITLGLTTRADNSSESKEKYSMTKDHLISPEDEYIDLSPNQVSEALELTKEFWRKSESKRNEPKRPSGPFIRQVRSEKTGLLLIYPLDPSKMVGIETETPVIGFAISFPSSRTARSVEYFVTNLFYEQEFGEE